ncbi:MAG: hypothetical protein AAGI66_03010 [Cyanobacteria bacterium P01_H01_bin.74]
MKIPVPGDSVAGDKVKKVGMQQSVEPNGNTVMPKPGQVTYGKQNNPMHSQPPVATQYAGVVAGSDYLQRQETFRLQDDENQTDALVAMRSAQLSTVQSLIGKVMHLYHALVFRIQFFYKTLKSLYLRSKNFWFYVSEFDKAYEEKRALLNNQQKRRYF